MLIPSPFFSAKIESPRRHGTVPVMVRALLVIHRDETYEESGYPQSPLDPQSSRYPLGCSTQAILGAEIDGSTHLDHS